MPTARLKNEKLAKDILEEFEPDEAELALSVLEIIEQSDGEADPAKIKKVAGECYKKKGNN